MDYSATLHDDDHPAGASPWASPGSPQHSRTFSGAVDPPSSPYRGFGSQTSSNGLANEHDRGGEGFEHEYRRPDTASTSSATDDDARTEVPSQAGGSLTEGHDASGQEQIPPSGEPNAPSRSSGDTAIPQGSEGQGRKPTKPVFKFQAKITGLERTGRKDSILRFDVHVRPYGTSNSGRRSVHLT